MKRWLPSLFVPVFIQFFLCIPPAQALRPVVPAEIVDISEASDSVGYVNWSGADVVDAEIGRWDTPYPYPDTGQYAPGLQPEGRSTLRIDIDVNDGGYITFRYYLQTYDAGIWDWYDIYLETPAGTVPLVIQLGKPGSQYGSYWQSARISLSKDLSPWRNQRVRMVFSVMQDGWGDQTQGQVSGFRVDTCNVPPLSPITDPVAIEFEAQQGNVFYTNPDRFHLGAQLACLQNAVNSVGGNYNEESAYRPTSYQAHLREVWDTWERIRDREEPECESLRQEVEREFRIHNMARRPAPPGSSLHESGWAFDLPIWLPESAIRDGYNIDSMALECGWLYRFDPIGDPGHFNLF